MSAEADFSKEFYQNSQTFFSERVEYTDVTALLLYWEENDINPEQEVDAVRELFEKDFAYNSITFPIPSQRAQQELNREISALVSNYSRKLDSLILIYYSGHGDADADGKSVWAAKEKDGTTLSWWKAEQLLYDAAGDVLIILDCCDAAIVSKGDKEGPKFEILGASAKGFRTPEPGRASFTTILIEHIRKSLKKGRQLNARGLHGELLESSHLTETPQYADLARKTPRSIVLQPLRSFQHEGFIKKPSSLLVLKVSLAEDPTGLRIAEWLKTHPPAGVTAVSVEALILKARKLQGLVDQTAFPPGSIFEKLPESAQRELLYRISGLDTAIQSAEYSAQGSLLDPKESSIAKSIKDIDQSVNAVCKAVETPILLDANFPDSSVLEQASNDDVAIALGAENALSLRRRLLNISAIPDGLELPRDALNFPVHKKAAQPSSYFRFGTLKDKDILAELIPYQTDDDNDVEKNVSPSETEIEQVERMTALLCQQKDPSFHILPCVGYINEPLNQNFAFVFEIPSEAGANVSPIALRQLYKGANIIPLGHRIQLAHELIVALENFHRVGWIHKNISSQSIMFLARSPELPQTSTSVLIRNAEGSTQTEPIQIDLASPWLFGFDASRPEEGHSNLMEDHSLSNNIYRHPTRWGRPTLKFAKSHDVYSLGIVLLEIAFWKDVLSIAEVLKHPESAHKSRPLVAEKVRETLSAKCNRLLPHQVGQVFADTILACLNFGESTKDMTDYDRHLYYETHVADRMAEAVGKI